MNGTTPMEPGAEEQWEATSWQVRAAVPADVPAVAIAVRELLVELGGSPSLPATLEETTQALIEDPTAGAVLVADNEGEIVGMLGISWQLAIRIPGRYGLIQELWVHPSWRGKTIGGDLLMAGFELARRRQVARLEVGLPSERFAHVEATEAFYFNNGFQAIGTRMRRLLS